MIVAYTALHYGSPYLSYAIRSVIEHVDMYYVLYSPHGSHGTRNTLPLPESESRGNLYRIAQRAAGEKLYWIDGNWRYEGQQRDSIFSHCPQANIVLALDYDEIWPDGMLPQLFNYVRNKKRRVYRVPIIHYWRSFRRCVLHDPSWPYRIYYPSGDGEDYINPNDYPVGSQYINHMGYAIPTWLTQYKMHIHGHFGEFDPKWMNDTWLENKQVNCHPCGDVHWDTEEINPLDYMPNYMMFHPYYGMEVIE